MTKRWWEVLLQGVALVLAAGLLLCVPAPARADPLTDGLGSMGVSTGGSVVASSTGNTLTFTYTADPSSGITAGTVELAVPDGWTAPQTTDPTAPGFASADALLLSTSPGGDGTGGTITLSGLTLAPGGQVQITYADAAAPSTGGSATFTSSEADGVDPPVQLSSSPSVQVLAPDGSGTMTASPGSVPAGYSQTLTFTYTADPGGIQDGTLDLAVPSGWTLPQTGDANSPGYVTTTFGTSDSELDQAGTVAILPAGSATVGTIEVTGLTLAAGDTLLISYADPTAPSANSYTFTTAESSAGGTTQPINTQPQVMVSPVIQPGSPSLVSASPGNGQVQLSWSGPTDDGGGAIIDYLINIYQGGDTSSTPTTIDTGSTNTSATVPSLTNGQQYTFTVQAVNSAGPGSASGPQSATLPTAPGIPSLNSASPGDQQVQLAWSAPDDGGSAIQNYVIDEYVGTDTSGSPAAVIPTPDASTGYTVTGLTNGTTYTFTVTAENSVGPSTASSSLTATPATVPAAPTLGSATPGNGQVTLSWSGPTDDGGAQVTDYLINEYVGGDTSSTPVVIDTMSTSSSYPVSGLRNGQQYTFTVEAVNSAGQGVASSSRSATPVTTPGSPVLAPPRAANSAVQLAWSAPDDGGSAIQYYVIDEYVGTDTSGSVAAVIDTPDASTGDKVAGLSNGTTYTFTVTAENSVGPGSPSDSVTATPATVAGAPVLVSADSGNGSVALSWSAPSDDGGAPVSDYVIDEYQGGDTSSAAVPVDTHSSATTATVSGLTNGQEYTFTVQALNSAGSGGVSTPQSATPATAPAAPSLAPATPQNESIQLSWAAPTDDGGAAVDDYVINEYVGGDTSTKPVPIDTKSAGTSYQVSGLTNGQQYTFTVQAINSAGSGAFSAPQSATPATTPGVPSLASASPGDGQVQLTWSAPSDDGGGAVSDYVIDEYQGDNTSSTAVPVDTHSAATSATVSGLTNGQQYTFTVQAINQAGGGSPSGAMSATPRTVPGAPTLSATPGAGKVALSWTTPDDGGAAIDDYVIEEYAGSSATGTPTTIDTGSTSHTVTGLSDGSAYTFEIEAVNAAGDGEPSNSATATPATVPGAPKLLATVAGSGLVETVWDPPAEDGGAAVSAYYVLRSTTAGSPGTKIATVAPGSSTNSYIDQSVANGTTYYYEVVAVNRAGKGPASDQFSAQPQSFLPPPVLVRTIAVGGHKVTFSAPNKCVRSGRVSGRLTVSSSSGHGSKLVIGKAVFKVGELATKIVTRRKRSSGPILVTIHARHLTAKHTYGFLAEPSIAVGNGSPHRHTLRLKITAC